MNAASIQSSVDSLKTIYTVILGLAIAEACKQFVAEKPGETGDTGIHYDRIPALLCFLLLIVPFYHGMLRYFFEIYNVKGLPSTYGASLIIDCVCFTIEALLFFILSRSLSPNNWWRFYSAIAVLLVVDLLWILIVNRVQALPNIQSWIYLDLVGLIVLVSILAYNYRIKARTMLSGVLLPLLLFFARTCCDYAANWSFYFPKPDSAFVHTALAPILIESTNTNARTTSIYLAGPLFSQAQWLWNKQLCEELELLNLRVTLPQRLAEPMLKGVRPFDPKLLFSSNVAGIEKADVVVAIWDEADPDSGTCWECGYARKLGVPVIGVRTDIRRASDDPSASVNLMLSQSCETYLEVPLNQFDDLKSLARRIAQAVHATNLRSSGSTSRSKPLVYIASPNSKGDPDLNVQFQCGVFDQILREQKAWPIAPLWSHFQNKLFPQPYEKWIAYEDSVMLRCDACLRLSAEIPEKHYKQSDSAGADAEVGFFRQHGKPVFFSIADLDRWLDQN